MFHPLLEQVRQEVSGERALSAVRALTRFHRVQASPGYDQASEWLAQALERAGLEVEWTPVPGDGHTRFLGQLMPEGWECTRARASLHAGSRREPLCDYETQPLSLILRSESAAGRYPIVALEDGTEDGHYRGIEVRGRVVMTSGDVHRVHRLAVLERGAAGLLSDGRRLVPPVRDRFDDPDAVPYTSFWWGEDSRRSWGFVVSPRVGAGLRARLAAGEALALEVLIESRAFPTTIPLLCATLPGEGAEEVLVLSHLCHPQPSANDNASGVAATLEAARALAALRRARGLGRQRAGIRFLWMPEFTGTYAWLASRPAEAPRIHAAVNLDMVGESQEACGSAFLLEHPPCFAASFAEELMLRIRERAVDWVPSYSGPGHYSLTRMAEVPFSGGSDHAVLVDPAIGIPCPMLIQWPDRFYHSSHDTPDKCDPRSLALAARCAATYAGFLATLGSSERDWLLAAVARGARRRLLAAADAPEGERALRREVRRGGSALASLERLGVEPSRIEPACDALETFARSEAGVVGSVRSAAAADGPPPARRVAAPIHYQRHLLPGWEALPRSTRERWRALEAQVPDGLLLAELAWYACDGKRSLEEIASLVELETGRNERDYLEQFFECTSELGLSETGRKDAAWSSSGPATDTR